MANAVQRRRKRLQRAHWNKTRKAKKRLVEGVAYWPSFHTPNYRKRHAYGSIIIGAGGAAPTYVDLPVIDVVKAFNPVGWHGPDGQLIAFKSTPSVYDPAVDTLGLHHKMEMEGDVLLKQSEITVNNPGDTELTYDNIDDYRENNWRRRGSFTYQGKQEWAYLKEYIHPLVLPDKRWITLKDMDVENNGRITRILEQEPNNTKASHIINCLGNSLGRTGFNTSEASVRRYRKHM